MSAKSSTWMPFYVGDYLRDTGRLTTENHGAYLLLILDYWTSQAPLPDDDEQLAAITRLPPARWTKARQVLQGYFDIADGLWRHKRVDAEIAKAKDLSKTRQDAGKRGGKAKANAMANDVAKAKQTPKQNPTPSPSQYSEGKPSDAGASLASKSPESVKPAQLFADPALPSESAESDSGPKPDTDEPALPPFLVQLGDKPDVSKVLFGEGLAWIAQQIGKEPAKCRALIGQWRKACGNDDRKIWGLLVEASKTGVADLPSWMTACLKPKGAEAADDGMSDFLRARLADHAAEKAKGAA